VFYGDSDSDGFGDPGAPLAACFLPAAASVNDDDCNDGNPAISPASLEVCDGVDNDCDGTADVGAVVGAATYYSDSDSDGLGAAGTGVTACNAPPGAVGNDSDCDDGETLVTTCGGTCTPCADGGGCAVPTGCLGGICTAEVCASPSCSDGLVNGVETDVDCGGLDCSPCSDSDACAVAADCLSEVCSGQVCQAPTCTDGVLNGDETSVDCGGSCPPGCSDGAACASAAGCLYGICYAGTCSSLGTGVDGPLVVSASASLGDVRANVTGAAAGTSLALTNETGTFAAGDLVFVHQSQSGNNAGDYEFAEVAAVGGGVLTLATPLQHSFSTTSSEVAQVLQVPQFTTVDVAGGSGLDAPSWNGETGGILAFVATGGVTVAGSLAMSSDGYRGVPRENTSNQPGVQGEGSVGLGLLVRDPNGNGGGGGERNGCDCCWGGAGAGGGHATSGSDGSNGGAACQLGGLGGNAVGSPEQTQLFFGGAGGQGGADEDGYGSGGANGGGIIFVAGSSVTITGTVTSAGQAGDAEVNFGGCGSGGGGGGAGGAIYLRTDSATLGANLVTATGGGSGDNPGNCGTPGGAGAVGRITVRGAASVTGTSDPNFSDIP